jgi:hypothetical protein
VLHGRHRPRHAACLADGRELCLCGANPKTSQTGRLAVPKGVRGAILGNSGWNWCPAPVSMSLGPSPPRTCAASVYRAWSWTSLPACRHWSEIVRPMLSDRGGWCTIIGTPKCRNEFFRIYEEALADPDRWFSLKLKASESGILPEHELADLRHMYRETPEAYEQEYAGIRMFIFRGDMRRLFRQTDAGRRGARAHHRRPVRSVAPCGHCMGLRDRGRYGHLGLPARRRSDPCHRVL